MTTIISPNHSSSVAAVEQKWASLSSPGTTRTSRILNRTAVQNWCAVWIAGKSRSSSTAPEHMAHGVYLHWLKTARLLKVTALRLVRDKKTRGELFQRVVLRFGGKGKIRAGLVENTLRIILFGSQDISQTSGLSNIVLMTSSEWIKKIKNKNATYRTIIAAHDDSVSTLLFNLTGIHHFASLPVHIWIARTPYPLPMWSKSTALARKQTPPRAPAARHLCRFVLTLTVMLQGIRHAAHMQTQ